MSLSLIKHQVKNMSLCLIKYQAKNTPLCLIKHHTVNTWGNGGIAILEHDNMILQSMTLSHILFQTQPAHISSHIRCIK